MDQQLLIPPRINVGFQERKGTYTGKLAYVVYYDLKGKLRKEASWNSWRDKKIPNVEFDNVPMEGFVLNKGVGGQRESYGWNARNEYIRVYDPRDFEFEISVANLLFILRECNCSKGKGLEGKFCYAWDGTELVLLPEISTDYQNSKKYTELQTCGVKAKEMVPGASYTTKKQAVLTYLGKFDWHFISGDRYYYRHKKDEGSRVEKRHVFWDGKNFVFMKDLKQIAVQNGDSVTPDFAELVTKYGKSRHGSKVVKLFTKPYTPKQRTQDSDYYDRDYWVVANQDGSFTEHYCGYSWDNRITPESIQATYQVSMTAAGDLKVKYDGRTWYNPQSRRYAYHSDGTWMTPTNLRLYAQLESGARFRITGGNFHGVEEDV